MMEDLLSINPIDIFFTLILLPIMFVVKLLLYPLNALIRQFLPELDAMLAEIPQYFAYLSDYVGWAASALAIPNIVIASVSAYLIFSVATTHGAWAIKLFLKWYHAIRL